MVYYEGVSVGGFVGLMVGWLESSRARKGHVLRVLGPKGLRL